MTNTAAHYISPSYLCELFSLRADSIDPILFMKSAINKKIPRNRRRGVRQVAYPRQHGATRSRLRRGKWSSVCTIADLRVRCPSTPPPLTEQLLFLLAATATVSAIALLLSAGPSLTVLFLSYIPPPSTLLHVILYTVRCVVDISVSRVACLQGCSWCWIVVR